MARYEHLPIYRTTYDLFIDVLQVTKTFSRDYRYTLGAHLHETAIKLLKQVYLINSARDKVDALKQMLLYIQEIGVLLRASKDLKIMAENRFFALLEKRDSLEKQTTGWLKSFEKNRAGIIPPECG